MEKPNRHRILSVFEHTRLKLGDSSNGITFKKHHLEALQKYYGEKGTKFFSLIHNGVKFCEYVGVINVGNLTIEILPKADRSNNKDLWRNVLIVMLKKVGTFNISAPSQAHLRLKSNHLLDLYFELFINEAETLLHNGLTKKYRSTESNLKSLKGNLLFSRHLNYNLVHQERFYVRNTVYDREHPLNRVLLKTILLIQKINCNPVLSSRIDSFLLDFPELPDIKVTDDWFNRIIYNRKTVCYKKAIEIARLLLLNYHPDLSQGRNHILALMFDMNLLWERFVYVSLRKYMGTVSIVPQLKKPYWKLSGCRPVGLKPDIVITKDDSTFVIDTKWKLLDYPKPSEDDLRQMYTYTKYFHSAHTLLCYPGLDGHIQGKFFDEENMKERYNCSILTIGIDATLPIDAWQKRICGSIEKSIQMENESNFTFKT